MKFNGSIGRGSCGGASLRGCGCRRLLGEVGRVRGGVVPFHSFLFHETVCICLNHSKNIAKIKNLQT